MQLINKLTSNDNDRKNHRFQSKTENITFNTEPPLAAGDESKKPNPAKALQKEISLLLTFQDHSAGQF